MAGAGRRELGGLTQLERESRARETALAEVLGLMGAVQEGSPVQSHSPPDR